MPSNRLPAFPLRTIAAILVSVASVSAHATDLVEAWRAARGHDATFAAAEASLRAALEKIPQGDALLASRLDLVATGAQARQDYRSGDSDVKPSAVTQGQQIGASLAFSKPVYDMASTVARDRLHREAEQAQAQFDQARQDLMLRVARAYFDVLLAQDNLKLAVAQEQAIAEQLGLAKKSYELGVTSVTDADDAQARYDSVVATEQADRTDLEARSDAFRTLTGLSAESLRAVAPTALPGLIDAAAMDDQVATARANNPTVRQLELGVQIARRQIDQYRLASSPVVSVVAGYGYQRDSGSISTSGARDRTGNASIGIQVSVPLLDGGSRRSLERQAVYQEDTQAQSLEAARRDSERLARQFAAAVRDGGKRIASLDRASHSGENSVNSSRIAREAGVRTTIDVLNAEQAWYATLYSLSTARCDLLYNRLQLAAQAGALDVASLEQINTAIAKP
jgi:outer membrane protein